MFFIIFFSERASDHGGYYRANHRHLRGHRQPAAVAPTLPHAEPHPRHGAHHRHRPDPHGDRRGHVPQARPEADAGHSQWVISIIYFYYIFFLYLMGQFLGGKR